MRPKPSQHLITLLALMSMVYGSVTPSNECSARAWVRAPDLTPGAIIHGDARIKIDAECPDIDNVMLGLRFKERSFVKALRSREDSKWLNQKPVKHDPFDVLSPWASMPSPFANQSAEDAYKETITNRALWIVREEERVVFETMHSIGTRSGNHHDGTLRDTVQDFYILVPSTNFPPLLHSFKAGLPSYIEREIVDVQWIYEYFARISFVNGTTKEISAGFTAFQPSPTYTSPGPTTTTVELLAAKPANASYSIEIRDDSGLTFAEGTKSHVVTAVVTRTGLPRTFSAPLEVSAYVMPDVLPQWVAEYDLSDANAIFFHKPPSVLRAERNPGVTVTMPSSSLEEIQAGEVVTTMSAPFTIRLDVDNGHVPTFETYYQAIVNVLSVTLKTPRTEDEDVDPDSPFGEKDCLDQLFDLFEDDEEEWIPWERQLMTQHRKTWRSYSGRIPVVVCPAMDEMASRQCRPDESTDTSDQVVMSDEIGCRQHSVLHYIDEGARGPAFVDHDTVRELLDVDPVRRDVHAPILDPVVTSPPEGEELVHRYYRRTDPLKPLIYVGETWARKVANRRVDVSLADSSHVTMYTRVKLDSGVYQYVPSM